MLMSSNAAWMFVRASVVAFLVLGTIFALSKSSKPQAPMRVFEYLPAEDVTQALSKDFAPVSNRDVSPAFR